MKFTLLELVQQVLSSIDGDEVNSINDTVESQQVVKIIERIYGNLVDGMDYPEKYNLFGLTSSGDSTKPTLMYLPDTMASCQWVKYDCKKSGDTDTDFQVMQYVNPEEFLKRMHALSPSEDTSLDTFTHTVNGQSVQFIITTNLAPSYYTTFDDCTFIFNGYDSAVDTTLQTSKTLAYGQMRPTWTASDTFSIPIDDHQLILNEAISYAWAEMKQAQNVKVEREIGRQRVTAQRKKHAIDPIENYYAETPNYGRK